jgi:hypothetical protein
MFPFEYNGRHLACLFVGKDARGGLWIKRSELDHVFGQLATWPTKVKNAPRELVEWDDCKYPAISAVNLPTLAAAQTLPGAKSIAACFLTWFSEVVEAAFRAPRSEPKAETESVAASAGEALEGELMTFAFNKTPFDIIVAVDDKDRLWATIACLEDVFGQGAPNWPRSTRNAPVKDIAYQGRRRPAVQDIWFDDIATAQPLYRKERANAFVDWWLETVETAFHPGDEVYEAVAKPVDEPVAVAPTPIPPPSQPSQEVLAPAQSGAARAREIAALLVTMAEEVEAKDREIERLRGVLAERAKAEKLRAEQIQQAFLIIGNMKL